jgi:Ca2+-binding RTX toxin-like protein
VLAGGAGRDVVDGGLGADRLDGGAGDDQLRARDGIADEIACGEGNDTVTADTLDVVAAGCEQVDRLAVAPPPGALELGADKSAPQLRAAAARSQRVSRGRRTIRLVATSSEAGAVATSGVLRIAGAAIPVVGVRRGVAVGGAGADLRFALSRRQQREVLAALRRGRRVTLALSVVATDRAGNSRELRLPRIRLVR